MMASSTAAPSDEAKVALVTGASSGIGEAIAKLLLEKGYKVAIHGSKKEKVDRVLAECAKLSPQNFQPHGIVLDFSEPTNGQKAVEQTIEHFGRLDVLVNNAGMFARTQGDDSQSYASYRHLMSVNLDSAVAATLASVEELKRRQGHLLFISSTASQKAHEKSYAYGASKAAMSMLAKCLAIDLVPLGIRVNVLSPGPVITDIYKSVGISQQIARLAMGQTTLEQRAAEPKEIAEVAYFLLSASNSFICGHELVVDGGYLLKPSLSSAGAQLRQASAGTGQQ